ncbi:NAD(+) diphosphatase [Butyrivibrio sp. AE3004]|uniref:NAD(+) diphosphatase n=1 Tax=Butyrivibrio sp. AE3004 TaxID=1506994 RepID=UPI000493C9AA|nr:NAD(+) diphosphatase [Butyrivibrio sp. AE3004]
MIQEILPKVFHNEFKNELPNSDDYIFSFRGRELLCVLGDNGEFRCPKFCETGIESEDLIYLFKIDDTKFFLPKREYGFYISELLNELDFERQYHYEDIRILRRADPGYLCFAGMTAYHLYVWYRDNRFCGRCGTKTVIYDKERALKCPNCGNIIYPKICPAVIVGVTDKNKIMMTRYAGRAYKGNALIAGFCEIGETAEDTVRREVFEEVGLQVKNIRYFASQPWGFDSNLLLGFFCELDGKGDIHIDENELAKAEWVDRSEIGEEAKNLSLTATMMMHFKEHPELFLH